MKRARTEGRQRQNYERKQFYWAKMSSYVAQFLRLNVKAWGHLSELCVCVREREKMESKARVNEERRNAERQTKRRRRNRTKCGWMELIELEWSIFHRSSHPLYSFRSTNHFILSFCDGRVFIYFIFSVALALIPMNMIRSIPIPDRHQSTSISHRYQRNSRIHNLQWPKRKETSFPTHHWNKYTRSAVLQLIANQNTAYLFVLAIIINILIEIAGPTCEKVVPESAGYIKFVPI